MTDGRNVERSTQVSVCGLEGAAREGNTTMFLNLQTKTFTDDLSRKSGIETVGGRQIHKHDDVCFLFKAGV